MRYIVSWCVHRRSIVAALAALALIVGVLDARNVPLDVFPEFVPVQVSVQTEAPGFAPEQVEELVTRQIEAAVNGAQDLAMIRSESVPGLSVVSLDFSDNADPYRARQAIAERVAGVARSLPTGLGTPELSPLTSSTMDLLKIGLTSDKLDSYALRERADWVLRPLLLGVPGVARITVYGGDIRQIQIQPNPEKLASYGFTLIDVADAARAALALRGAGFMDLAAQRVLINTPTPAPDTNALGEAVIAVRQGVPVHIRDVAAVMEAPALHNGDATIQGHPGVLLAMSSQYGANTLEVTHAIEDALASIAPSLEAEGVKIYPGLHRPANFIERARNDITQSLAIAAVLILLVLFAFLRNWRSALISFLAIPLSLVAATVVLGRFGQTMNTMTLGGFAVALGVLVDDAIIDVENILRRLRENATLDVPRPRLDVVRDASLEILGPVVYATLVVLVVFLPVLMTSGVQGRFVAPLALAFILAVIASLFVAITVTPALGALILSHEAEHRTPRWIVRLKDFQKRASEYTDEHFKAVVIVLTAVFVSVLVWLPFLSGQFMPDFREGHFVVQVESAIPGTSLEEMKAVGANISRDMLALPFIATVEQQLGRSEGGEDAFGTQTSEFHVELKEPAGIDQTEAQDQLRELLKQYPGINSEVVTFLGDRFSESLSGETAQVVINVFGEDLETLDKTAASISQILQKIDGVADLQVQQQSGTPALSVALDPEAVAAYGLKAQDVLDALQSAFAGATVGQTYTGVRKTDVVLILPDELRHRIEQVGQLTVGSPLGPVPLRSIARIEPAAGRYSIQHEGGQRRVPVTFNVSGRALQTVVNEAKAQIAAMPPRSNVYVRFAGQAEAERAARLELFLYAALALVLVMLILFLCFSQRAHPWLVLVNLPFSLIGSVLAIGVSGIGLSIGTLVGLITVFGVGARNSILLLAHYEHLVEVEGQPWNAATVLRGASERLVPILMTAAVTALGLAPIAIGLHKPGQEIEGPMAITVLGGLATSTVLNLLVMPALAKRFSYRTGVRDKTVAVSQLSSYEIQP